MEERTGSSQLALKTTEMLDVLQLRDMRQISVANKWRHYTTDSFYREKRNLSTVVIYFYLDSVISRNRFERFLATF
jgi:hypothetical protein